MRISLRSTALAFGVLLAAAALPASRAQAQLVAVVYGEAITALDVAQRTRLLTLLNQGHAPTRSNVVQELVDERLKLREARRFSAVPGDDEVDRAFAGVAGRARMTPEQFTQMLGAQGASAKSFKDRLRADIAWNGLVRARFKVITQVGDRDVADAMGARKQEGVQATEYTLRQVVFVVPRGSAEAAYDGRRREAEGLRARFQSCEEGIGLARGLREVVVRDPIRRLSSDLTPALRELFANTAVGKATAPERTEAGVEMVAVCGKRDVSGQSSAQNDVRQELAAERLKSQADRYIAELRKAAMIEYR